MPSSKFSSMSTESVFERFEHYPFDADLVFQNGLASIVAPLEGKPIDEVNEMIGRAKAFYWNRSSGEQLNWDDYVRYREEHSGVPQKSHLEKFSSALASATLDEAAQPPSESTEDATALSAGLHGASPPLSFSNIAELIVSGQTHLIPNNEVIPDILSEEKPSESHAPIRKKPWETKTAFSSDLLAT